MSSYLLGTNGARRRSRRRRNTKAKAATSSRKPRSLSRSRSSSRSRSRSASRTRRSTTGSRFSNGEHKGHRTGDHHPGSSNQGLYVDVPKGEFCGPAGGADANTYPTNTPGRARAAKAYAHYAPNPAGIRACADRAERRHGWGEYAAAGATKRSGSKRGLKSANRRG